MNIKSPISVLKLLIMSILYLTVFLLFNAQLLAQDKNAQNPIIFADVPDMSIARVDDTYYMSSTTMHMNPGIPIMKSTDLVNWKLVNYAYDILEESEELNLENGKNAYGRGSWASCLRYRQGTFYLSTFSGTTGKTYIYTAKNIETSPWQVTSFSPPYHDHSIFYDDNGKVYMIWGAGQIKIVELKDDLTGVKIETEQVLIENAQAPIQHEIMLPAEGSQLFKVGNKYYLFNIAWPKGGMRTVVVHRADQITGPYEGRIVLQDKGIAQGGLIDTPDGRWFAYLFRDYGSVGRIPYLVPLQWVGGWPVLGVDGKVPEVLDLPASKDLIPGIVSNDEFTRKNGDLDLPLVWQWNHNPDNKNWSINRELGYLRLTNGRVDTDILQSRNMLTQRTIGPQCTGITTLDVSHMKEGDRAGLMLLQKKYGWVGVKYEKGQKYLVMVGVSSDTPEEIEQVPLKQTNIYFKATCDFNDRRDLAEFYYSLDGLEWKKIGGELQMAYTLPHFMGYRFGLFSYATKVMGGYVDFDYFKISNASN